LSIIKSPPLNRLDSIHADAHRVIIDIGSPSARLRRRTGAVEHGDDDTGVLRAAIEIELFGMASFLL
jgi:hypothetical protein